MTSTETGLGIEAKSDAIYELVEQGSQVERLATGFTFTEGPIWNPKEQYLLFSDMPGDVRRKYTPADGSVVEVRNFSNKCNGMTYDADLNLLVCEHVTSSLVKESPDGTREIIAQEFEGEELNSPNDVCVHSSGAIYFSDPWYGRFPGFGHPRKRRLGFQGVYRIAPGGSDGGDPELIVGRDEFEMPNGICFNPDETLFYINDTPGAFIKVYDADGDGNISNGRMFFEGVGSGVIEEGIPDGMKCDERGNIWVTGPGGVWVISAAGEHLGTILVPENTGNMTWGGAGLAHALHPELHVSLRDSNDCRPPQGAVHGRWRMNDEGLTLDASRCALIIQDLQNDVIIDDGAFAESGSPDHAREQNVVENVKALAETCRSKGIPVIHVWYIVEEGAPGLKLNAGLFQGVKDTGALVRGSWGAAPAEGLEAQDGDYVVEKMRMSAWQGTRLENLLAGLGRDTIIVTGAWTNMSIEHTSRTGADKGYFMVVPEDGCSTMNADWHNASINYALQNVSTVTTCAAVTEALAGVPAGV